MPSPAGYLDRLDVREAMLARRRVPCICPRQHETSPPIGETVAVTFTRTATVERVRCTGCARCWTRIDAE